MRHTFAHAVLRATGGDLPVTQQLLGHASIATTGIYVKADMSQRLKAVMALPVMFDSGGPAQR
ncbi:Tyrosine recombinase XerC [compost metagenome]